MDMDTLEHTFEFEEMNIPVCGKYAGGLMLYGKATLSGDEDGFSVVYVELEGGARLRPRGNGDLGFPSAFEDALFKRIAGEIENGKTVIGKRASSEWADEVAKAYSSHGRMLNRADALYDARV
jgi:hypothetical protein